MWQEEAKHENSGQSYNSDNNDNPCDSDSMSELSTLCWAFCLNCWFYSSCKTVGTNYNWLKHQLKQYSAGLFG